MGKTRDLRSVQIDNEKIPIECEYRPSKIGIGRIAGDSAGDFAQALSPRCFRRVEVGTGRDVGGRDDEALGATLADP